VRRLATALALLVAVGMGAGAQPSRAGDDVRRGFIAGFGAGPGGLFGTGGEARGGIGGLQTELKLGHGVSDRWLLHYTGPQLWTVLGEGLVTGGFPSVGATHFFEPQAPSAFVQGSVGAWLLGAVGYEGAGAVYAGPGAFVGLGHEFSPHWTLTLSAGAGHLEFASSSFVNVGLTLGYLAY
jgi:hypothetical protein